MSDRASEIIASGDTPAVLRIAVNAMTAAAEGRFCTCAAPMLHGRDLMCGACLLENAGQREQANRRIREPHAFEPGRSRHPRLRKMFCGICAMPVGDPRHESAGSPGGEA